MNELQKKIIPDDIMTAYTHISLMGRLAYLLMCIEAYLVNVYPDRDWRVLAKAFWFFPKWMASDWIFFFYALTPDFVLHPEKQDDPFCNSDPLTPEEVQCLKQQYIGITEGNRDDPNDVLCTLLNIPPDLMNYYDAVMSDGNFPAEWIAKESIEDLKKIAKILFDNHIELPDIHKLDFLKIPDDMANWLMELPYSNTFDCFDVFGPHFDGPPLSIILHRDDE